MGMHTHTHAKRHSREHALTCRQAPPVGHVCHGSSPMLLGAVGPTVFLGPVGPTVLRGAVGPSAAKRCCAMTILLASMPVSVSSCDRAGASRKGTSGVGPQSPADTEKPDVTTSCTVMQTHKRCRG